MSHQQPKPDPEREIIQQEIESAVLRSGYPLEIRLLEVFEAAKMDPRIGTLVRPGDVAPTKDNLATREIDIVASFGHRLPLAPRSAEGQDAIHTTLSVIVAAKNLAPSGALVGFTWKPVETRELQLLRCQLGGSPTTVLDGYPEANQLALAERGLCECFAPLGEAPVCVLWSIARRDDTTSQERRYWRDLDVLVRAERMNAVAASHACLGGRGPGQVLLFQVPLLVVATKTLHVYDALAKKFTATDWFTLRRPFDLGDRSDERLVDIVTESGVPRFLAACERTMSNLERRIEKRKMDIAAVAVAQHAKYKRALQDTVLRE